MATYIALLRGINVEGNDRITMTALRELVAGLGYGNVQTYANSGNVVFTTTMFPNGDLARNIHDAVQRQLDMNVDVVVRTDEEMRQIVAGSPYPERTDEPETLHVAFLAGTPDPDDVAKLAEQERGDVEYRIVGDHIYLSCPHGASGSVFQPKLGIPQTIRDWTTVTTLAEMAEGTAG